MWSNLILLCCFLSTFPESLSKIHNYTFNVKYTSGSPDGVWKDKILTINGLFPGPTITATEGNTIRVTLINNIQDGQNTSIHWHGIHQRGTPFQDGTNMLAQCPLKVGEKQLYDFPVKVPGSYWYHAHVKSQYTEGLWGPLIVKAKEKIYEYDDEILITIGDWYHRTADELEFWHLSRLSKGAPPFPDSALINGRGRTNCTLFERNNEFNCTAQHQKRPVFKVKPGKTYRIRVINVSGYSAFRFAIDGHKLHVIECDATYVRKTPGLDVAVIASAQRYSFLVTMNATGNDQFLIRADLMTEILFRDGPNINEHPDAILANATGILRYVTREDRSHDFGLENFNYTEVVPASFWSQMADPHYLNDNLLQDHSGKKAPGYFDQEYVLNVTFVEIDGVRRGAINNISFKLPDDKPLLLKMMASDEIPDKHNPLFLRSNDVIQVVINNPFDGRHPFHFHGHSFWVLGTGKENDTNYDPLKHDLVFKGVRRDTVVVHQNSWVVIRFQADNPGVWALHCHIDWHNLSGMAAVFIEAPEFARQNLTMPAESARICSHHGITI